MDELKQYIDYAIAETIQQLRANAMLNERMPVNQKAEELLKNYELLQKSKNPLFYKLIDALEELQNDPYNEIMHLIYFEGWTVALVAEEFRVSERTVKRHKRRLLFEIGKRVFTDDWLAGM